MTSTPEVEFLADHSALLAIPAFAPAIAVVGVVVWIAMRDRLRGDDEDDDLHSDSPASSGEDGTP
ncbi:hypothetical protein [Mycolicibacterium sediminis]|uniref:Uncharacterized protein n=1 Tax=Mycolicibacterium sediminis TaxID=1286180 RepID=A0A7I7QKK8_9MYCO|nr:hypothetical protein [Mycolicibacterium sediminis]BBY26640.1 hypothetical protein MSEDJ_07360 [Mycolicibacterium sediminis]